MTYDTVITNSHVILPQGMLDKNIIIDEGKIVGLTNDIPACDRKINGNGLISIPGAIDTHVHYGVSSPINEAAKTESHAAAIGGITTMMRMLRLENKFSNSLFFGILRVYFFASTPKELKLILTPVSEISSLIFSDSSNKSSNSCNAFLIFS